MKTRFATLIAALTVAVSAQGDTPSPTQDIAIKNIDAATAFQSLRASFPDASGVVTAIKLDSNSLTVIADHPKAAELRKRLAEMDVRPKQIMIEAVITEVDADGSEFVTRSVRTCLCLVDGIPVEIPMGKDLKLKITPTSVPGIAATTFGLSTLGCSEAPKAVERALIECDKELCTRTFRVPPDFTSRLNSGRAPANPAERAPIFELLKSNGINFGEGSSATLTANGTLLVTNTPSELDKLEQLINASMPDGR